MNEHDIPAPRSETRQFVAQLVIVSATLLALGHVIRQPSLMAANDISRWCTVWSLLERGSYVIDDCPWQLDTQDKILTSTSATPAGGTSDGAAPVKHYYSSKPALLPTLIAGILYPVRRLVGVPMDSVVLQPRVPRAILRRDAGDPTKLVPVIETPADPVKWPAYPFYCKPILILFNIIPYAIFLTLFARVLDRYAPNDWSWFFSLVAAAFGTYLLPFTQTLNNHSVAAFSAFFALYQFLRISEEDTPATWRFVVAGFFASFTATNELPALSFTALCGGLLLMRFPRKTIFGFFSGAAVPIVAFVAAQFAVFGKLKLAYEGFGSPEYLYEGSFWNTPLDLDALNIAPESYPVYLLHMTLGHHGIFSLTPIFLFSALGAARLLTVGGVKSLLTPNRDTPPMSIIAGMTTILTVVMLAFYTWNPKARNYGGSTQGLRWLMWLIPFWLLLLPAGVKGGQNGRVCRNLALAALAFSVLSVGYATRNPWTHPWILDALEHLGLYPLIR
jgi:hypothetical protein